jgi:hypothetical protein
MQDAAAFLSARRLPPLTAEGEAALTRIQELPSRVTQRDARAALLRMRAEKPELFASAGLYMHVHALLSRHGLALPIRRFLHNLFDRVSFNDRAWEAAGELAGASAAGAGATAR